MSKKLIIDGVSGTWTPDPDDGWEYVGIIEEFEEGFEYQYDAPSRGWSDSLRTFPSKIHEYRRRPKPIWHGAGFYQTSVDETLIGLIKYPTKNGWKYLSRIEKYAEPALVRLVRKFTTEEILRIVNDGIWPEVVE